MNGWIRIFAACLFSVAMVTGSHTPPAFGSPPDFLEGAQTTRPPMGYLQFCRDYSEYCDPGEREPFVMALTPDRSAELERVNRVVNTTIRPVTDMELHGIPEHWSLPVDGAGDCEDYVLLKRKRLMAKGWPKQSLMITVVLDRRGDGHAVLTARTSQGDLILDNQVRDIRPWYETNYRFVKRQSERDPAVWVAIAPQPQRNLYTAGNEGPPPPSR